MKYFITGATGFIGGKLARRLVDEGHQVIALVRTPAKATDLQAQGIELAQGDITDKASMRAPMTGVDGVFHIAAWYKVGAKDNSMAEAINVDGTRNVLDLMRELAIPKGVYTSTVGVFGNTKGQMVDESYQHQGGFLTEYERTKWMAHYQVAQPMIDEGLPLVIVMPGAVYGPGDQSDLRDAVVDYLKGQFPMVPQGTALCWSHVDDIVEGHILAMDKGTNGESYIIAGEPATLVDYFQLAEDITGVPAPKFKAPAAMLKAAAALAGVVGAVMPLPPAYSAEALRSLAGVTFWADNSKAKRELGYTPRTLKEGLPETLHYEMDLLGMTPQT